LGNDTYDFSRGDGHDFIEEIDTTLGNTDTVQFGEGIHTDQLWFRLLNNEDLEVNVIGTEDRLTIRHWLQEKSGMEKDTAGPIDQFKTAKGATLLDTQVDRLIQAMASFAPPAPGQITLPPDYQTALTPVLVENWK